MAAIASTAQHAERTRTTGSRFMQGLSRLFLTLTAPFDSYRPELHYMRGPGPKWHAKHAPAAYVSTTLAPRPHAFERVIPAEFGSDPSVVIVRESGRSSNHGHLKSIFAA
jgi:hypothetical protein